MNDRAHVFCRFKRSDGELERDSRGGMEEAETADFHEALGEHVLEKTPDELEGFEAQTVTGREVFPHPQRRNS